MTIFETLAQEARELLSERVTGRIDSITGLTVRTAAFNVPVGADCVIETRTHGEVDAEAVGSLHGSALLSVLGETGGIAPGDPVTCRPAGGRVAVGWELLGRVIDARGRPLDGKPPPRLNLRIPLYADAPPALSRRAIDAPLGLGVRAIDGLLTAGRGQRLGIFAGTGVGKSVLMGTICGNTSADVSVVALLGERGREARDFVEQQLGPRGLERSVVIVCTSDEPPALRVRAGFCATAVAEFFRERGADVLLMVDSITRLAMAQRQIGLAAGEPPTAKGYPPSTFALLPRLLERAGRTREGSITGIYTVLVEGGDIDEPLSDAVRGILDGHIWLSRSLANRGHFPAIDVLASVSRVAGDVTGARQQRAARLVRSVLATWADIEDLVSIGAYVPGANADYDVAVRTREAVQAYLRQERGEACPYEEGVQRLDDLAGEIERVRADLGRS